MIDLHLHTTASDGQCSPGELICPVRRWPASSCRISSNGVRPRDPIAYAAAIALILAISPMGALRAE